MTTSPDPVRIAVVGTGAIAQVSHLPILARMKGVRIVGLFDRDAAKARTLAERFEVPHVYASLRQLWDDPEVDAAIIATPNSYHEEQVREGLEAGKFIFCEKPLALNEASSKRVLSATGADSRLMVGMNQRFRPDAAALKTFVSGGELGDVFYLRAGWLNRGIARDRRTWRLRKTGAGGGALMDLGIQILDLSLWLLDYPDPVRMTAHLHKPSNSEVEDSAILLLYLANDQVLNIEVGWGLLSERESQYAQILGSAGSGALSPLRVYKELDSGLADVTPALAPGRENQFTASYRQELAFFADAVRGEHPLDAPTEHVTLLRITDAAYRSAEKGKEIRF